MWDNVRIYEMETAGLVYDIPFWESILDQFRPRRVLELACGTGRLTFPLADRGLKLRDDFEIVGLDQSAPFVARAKDRQAQHGVVPIKFMEGDMRSFEFVEPFDLIFIGANSFAYLLTTNDQLSCLHCIKKHLSPDGHFVIDSPAPPYEFLSAAQMPLPSLRLLEMKKQPVAGVDHFLEQGVERYDAGTQIVRRSYIVDIQFVSGSREQILDEVEIRITFPQELLLLLRTAGLTAVERFGGVNRSPFSGSSRQFTWVLTHSADSLDDQGRSVQS